MNRITITGNLGKDPETRYIPSGDAVTNFSVAVNERWTGKDGQPKKRTIWYRVTAFGKLGENVAKYLHAGSHVYVEGRLNADNKTGGPRIFTRTDGSAGSSFEITASTVEFLDRKPAGNDDGETSPEVAAAVEDQIPF